jgi:hypothetical protein
MKRFWKNNSLSIVFLVIFIIFLFAQSLTGWKVHNEDREEELHQRPLSYTQYISSGHFIQATFENWESEFLQMGLFILLTISLRQKGSSESKSCDEPEEVDRKPDPTKKDAPWPVKKGGWWLAVYKSSLSIAFFILFILSIVLHFYGSLKDSNAEHYALGQPRETALAYLVKPRFWFESFQNWQSEFLSVFSIVVLSIFLRQYGSPQSKPVDAPDSETGG